MKTTNEMKRDLWTIQQFLESNWEKYDPDVRPEMYYFYEMIIDSICDIRSSIDKLEPFVNIYERHKYKDNYEQRLGYEKEFEND